MRHSEQINISLHFLVKMHNDGTPEDSSFPIIDFSRYNGTDTDRLLMAQELIEAFKSYGSAILLNHLVHDEIISRSFSELKKFFDSPLEQKMKYAHQSCTSNRGYISTGREVFETEQDFVDVKEAFNIGKEGEKGFENHWPQELPTCKSLLNLT